MPRTRASSAGAKYSARKGVLLSIRGALSVASETAGGHGLTSRRWLAASLLVVAAVLALYFRLRPQPTTSAGGSRPRGRGAAASDLPRIDLARLSSPLPATKAGRRDLFGFGEAEPDEEEAGAEGGRGKPSQATQPTPAPLVTPNPQIAPPPAPRLVAINLKYIGSLEAQGGVKVAVLLTDRNEILYGQVGQQVANRFKILRIGLESVEIFDDGAGQSRRIPLKGN